MEHPAHWNTPPRDLQGHNTGLGLLSPPPHPICAICAKPSTAALSRRLIPDFYRSSHTLGEMCCETQSPPPPRHAPQVSPATLPRRLAVAAPILLAPLFSTTTTVTCKLAIVTHIHIAINCSDLSFKSTPTLPVTYLLPTLP